MNNNDPEQQDKQPAWARKLSELQDELQITSLEGLAAALGVGVPCIRAWQLGKRSPSRLARRAMELLQENRIYEKQAATRLRRHRPPQRPDEDEKRWEW